MCLHISLALSRRSLLLTPEASETGLPHSCGITIPLALEFCSKARSPSKIHYEANSEGGATYIKTAMGKRRLRPFIEAEVAQSFLQANKSRMRYTWDRRLERQYLVTCANTRADGRENNHSVCRDVIKRPRGGLGQPGRLILCSIES